MEKKKIKVVGIGELLWDLLPSGKKAGGAPVNFVYHATQLGAEGYAISAVGEDELGKEIIDSLDKYGIGHLLSTVDKPTGVVDVQLENGIPSYTIIEEVAWDYIPINNEVIELVKEADAICFGTLALRSEVSRKNILSLLDYAREDALRFFDINIRQHYYSAELIELLLKRANVFKINDEELDLLRGMFLLNGDDATVCRNLMQIYGLRYLILTAGSRYSTIYTQQEVSRIETPKVEVVDTVGAGDSFSGAFVYGILTGLSLSDAHKLAVKTAAYVCSKSGAWPQYSKNNSL